MFLEERKDGMRKFVYWTLLIFTALFPFLLYRGYLYAGTSSRAVTLMFVIDFVAIAFGFILFSKKAVLKVLKSPIMLALGGYLLILCISMVAGVDSGVSFWSKAARSSGMFYLSHLALFVLFLTWVLRDRVDARRFLKWFLIAAGLFSIGYLVGPEGFKLIYATRGWDGFTFANSSFAAMYLFAAFMLSIYYVATTARPAWWKYLLPLVFVINPSFIHPAVWGGDFSHGIIGESTASSYTALFSVVALAICWGISKIPVAQTRRALTWGIAIFGILVIAVATKLLLSSGSGVQKWYLEHSSGARPILWAISQKMIAQRPLFGWGPDNFDIAYEEHYDITILEEKKSGEPWFDRAHNVFIDQTVDTGYIGVIGYIAVYLIILWSLLSVVLRAKDRNDQVLAVVLAVYFGAHIAELQTAFDTTISYLPLSIMAVLSALAYHRMRTIEKKASGEVVVPQVLRFSIGLVLIGYFGWALFGGTMPIASANAANGKIRLAGVAEKRLALYPKLFTPQADLPSFVWRTSTDFQRGVAENPKVLESPELIALFVKELDVFASEYRAHLERHPKDYRSYLSLADILIYYRLFEVDKLDEAHRVLSRALELHDDLPQAYWMKAVAYLYQSKFKEAREWAAKGKALNPNIEESQQVVDYIERSIKSFPEIDLFFFRKI